MKEATEALHAGKVAILRRHLLEKVPISELCDKQGLQPTVFYLWQKEFFENGAAAFQPKTGPNHSAEQERIAYLEKKIQIKDEVPFTMARERPRLRNLLIKVVRFTPRRTAAPALPPTTQLLSRSAFRSANLDMRLDTIGRGGRPSVCATQRDRPRYLEPKLGR